MDKGGGTEDLMRSVLEFIEIMIAIIVVIIVGTWLLKDLPL